MAISPLRSGALSQLMSPQTARGRSETYLVITGHAAESWCGDSGEMDDAMI